MKNACQSESAATWSACSIDPTRILFLCDHSHFHIQNYHLYLRLYIYKSLDFVTCYYHFDNVCIFICWDHHWSQCDFSCALLIQYGSRGDASSYASWR
jgi:hypothetical protein